MDFRILITGTGRRVELMQAFRQASLKLNIGLKIYGTDMAGTAPALSFCDYTRIVCGMREPNYINELLQICKKDKIDLIIPTIDTDLLVLAENKSEFEKIGTKVMISAPEKIAICRDKNYTSDFFESCGLKAPKTYNDYKEYNDVFPCFIKPKDGSSSINAFRVENPEQLSVYAEKIEDYVIQPFIEGNEYTIDIFCDFEGNPVYVTPRERLAVRAGEVLKTKICNDGLMIDEAKMLIKKFKPCGPITVQLIKDKNTNTNYYIEINPRYGGGAPLSMKAGARSAEAVLLLLAGEKLDFQQCFSDGAIYSRFDQSVCVEQGESTQTIKGVIFDLDDTLYSEKEYVKSGYSKVAEFLNIPDAQQKLWSYFEQGKPAIDEYLKEIGMFDKKQECLSVYRNHFPNIHTYSGVIDLIQKLKSLNIKVGIITDGRVEGQQAKIKALGLENIVDDIIITDSLGGVQFRKPNDISFRIMQCKWRIPFEQLVYIGDNLHKDFQAPKQLGMQWIYFNNEDGLYTEKTDGKCKTINQITKKLSEKIEGLE